MRGALDGTPGATDMSVRHLPLGVAHAVRLLSRGSAQACTRFRSLSGMSITMGYVMWKDPRLLWVGK